MLIALENSQENERLRGICGRDVAKRQHRPLATEHGQLAAALNRAMQRDGRFRCRPARRDRNLLFQQERRCVYCGGSLTTQNQNSLISLTILVNCSRSTGLVT